MITTLCTSLHMRFVQASTCALYKPPHALCTSLHMRFVQASTRCICSHIWQEFAHRSWAQKAVPSECPSCNVETLADEKPTVLFRHGVVLARGAYQSMERGGGGDHACPPLPQGPEVPCGAAQDDSPRNRQWSCGVCRVVLGRSNVEGSVWYGRGVEQCCGTSAFAFVPSPALREQRSKHGKARQKHLLLL